MFPAELRVPLRHTTDRTEITLRWTEFERIGHLPATEEPDLLTEDVRALFQRLRA
ncbi:hypothetical protein ACWCQS_06660 [Streptomyces sp. NPDC002076]